MPQLLRTKSAESKQEDGDRIIEVSDLALVGPSGRVGIGGCFENKFM
jgi:hypothetical protein